MNVDRVVALGLDTLERCIRCLKEAGNFNVKS